MHRTLRFSLAALIVAAAVYFGSSLVFNDSRTEAGPPQYWLTADASELAHIRSLNAEGTPVIEFIEERNGIAIAKADELQLAALSGKMHESFHKCSGFIRHSTYEEAVETISNFAAASPDAAFVDYTIDNQAAVTPMVAAAQEPTIRQTIIDLSALHTRRHDQQGGLDGANMILSKWRTLATGRSDMSVMPYAHLNASGDFLTPQPSIVLTIQGTEFPDEIVVVGGHQDSINSSGGATGNAPGADDDASGIASMTEAIRVIKEKNFRPKRTVQFMAYAAEEIGLVGSKNIADNYRLQNKNVIGALQLDMTNFKGASADIAVITDFTNAAQNQFIKNLVTAYQPSLVVIDSACGYACSDHASWHNKQYPASMPFEAKYPAEYNTAIHKTTDTLDRSNNNANHALKFSKLAI
ncbi:MAG: M20/M25/M40 family metallo-hydrolase, partial [Pyrinomonadaceae bacterium]|nr:M20/M25/M40 family metallo-hydrolase [Pyrinomonadaceae bacterium]